MIRQLFKNSFVRFTLLFLGFYTVLYFAVQFITGLAVVGGWYSPSIAKYFDVAHWLRSFLMISTQFLLSVFGYKTIFINEYVLRLVNGNGIRIVYACLGFAVMCFWVALVCASKDTLRHKILWLAIGLIFITVLNVVRLSLVLVAANKGWVFPLGWDHHQWFNLLAYLIIFVLMYFYDKSIKLKI